MVSELREENVLVTGGAGFIGSALVKRLLENDNRVTALDNFVTGDIGNLQDAVGRVDGSKSELDENINLVSGDILRSDLSDLLETDDIDYVFHLAAEPYIPSCYDRPEEFFSVNANGTLKLLLACKEAGVERIVTYSSSEVYGTAQEVPMDETHRTYPQSTYAVSKLAADRLCFTLYHEQDVPVVILRQFNCYGPRETHPYIVPELIAQLSQTSDLSLGNINASRDLTYVTDAVRGASKLINSPEAEGEVVNLGYGEDFTVEDLAYMVADEMDKEDIHIDIEQERFRPLDVQQLCCNYSKAEKLIGYEPTVSIQEGLARTVSWYREEGPWTWENSLKDQLWKD
jgi:nucleoside-diphosphate-sugar epimerase